MSIHKFNLVENALESLEHAIEHLTHSPSLSKSDYKRAIIDLAHVAELLFKERLRKIHPAFVFSNVDKFLLKDAITVSAADAILRLQKIGKIKFRDEDESALKILRETRNNIEHYEFEFEESKARIIIGNVLVFIFKFSFQELALEWANRQINDSKWRKLIYFTEFFTAQRAHILSSITESDIPFYECTSCHSETFNIETKICVLCGFRDTVLTCSNCQQSYLLSEDYNAEVDLCPRCSYNDGYTATHFEKY